MERKIEVDRACERLRVEVEEGAREAGSTSSSSEEDGMKQGGAASVGATGRVYEAFNRYLALSARWLGKGNSGDARRLLASGAEVMAGVGCVQEAQELTLRMIGIAEMAGKQDADDADLALSQLMLVLRRWPVRAVYRSESARGEQGGFKAAPGGQGEGSERTWLGFDDMPEEVKTFVIVIETALNWAKDKPTHSQAVHGAAARYLHQTGSFYLLRQSSRHYVWAGESGAQEYAEALAEIVQNRAPCDGGRVSTFVCHCVREAEHDLFITRAVLQYLSVGRTREALICLKSFRSLVPVDSPLIHFTEFLLDAAKLAPRADEGSISGGGRHGCLDLVRLLRKKYEKSIARDGSGNLSKMLDRAEVAVFGAVPPPRSGDVGGGDMMVHMLQGMLQA